MSKKHCDYKVSEPLSMEDPIYIIVDRKSGGKCECWNSVYETSDTDCKACGGTGVTIVRTHKLTKAVLRTAGKIADEGDPIVYACTQDADVSVGDGITCKGVKYIVVDIGAGFTLGGKEVLICGLDYERDHNHSKAVLRRYQ